MLDFDPTVIRGKFELEIEFSKKTFFFFVPFRVGRLKVNAVGYKIVEDGFGGINKGGSHALCIHSV